MEKTLKFIFKVEKAQYWYGNKVKVIDELEEIINIECN